MKRKYVLKNKRRFATIVMLFSLVVIFSGMIVHAGAASQAQDVNQVVQVSKGDTLWEIASCYSDNTDPRAYIYEIKEINHLDSDNIYAGQELYLP